MQKGVINPDLYGIPGIYTGLGSIAGKVPSDLACVLGTEYTIYQYAPILDLISENKQLPAKQTELLDTISILMKSLDAESLTRLEEIYNTTPEIQITKSFKEDILKK